MMKNVNKMLMNNTKNANYVKKTNQIRNFIKWKDAKENAKKKNNANMKKYANDAGIRTLAKNKNNVKKGMMTTMKLITPNSLTSVFQQFH